MHNLVAAVVVSAFTFATAPLSAQEKKEPVKEDTKPAEVKKAEAKKDEPAKADAKKKVKKGGC